MGIEILVYLIVLSILNLISVPKEILVVISKFNISILFICYFYSSDLWFMSMAPPTLFFIFCFFQTLVICFGLVCIVLYYWCCSVPEMDSYLCKMYMYPVCVSLANIVRK